MAKFKIGDKVRVKDRLEWPSGYPNQRFANLEGQVVRRVYRESSEEPDEFKEFVDVLFDKTKLGGVTLPPNFPVSVEVENILTFHEDVLEKIG